MSTAGVEEIAHKLSQRKTPKHRSVPDAQPTLDSKLPIALPTTKKRKRAGKDVDLTELGHPPHTAHDSKTEQIDPTDIDKPVISHAQARKERKSQRQKLDPTLSEPSPDEANVVRSNTSPSLKSSQHKEIKTRRQNSVWIGNLSFKTSAQQLETFLQFAGEITRVNMPMKAGEGGRSENRGFAYVDFATPEAKTEAITYSERNLDGRRLLIKDGSDYSGRPALDPKLVATATDSVMLGSGPSDIISSKLPPSLSKFAQKILRSQKQPPAPTLFVGNLSFEATQESIKGMIEAHEVFRAKKAMARSKQSNVKEKGKEKEDVSEEPESDGGANSAKGEPTSLVKVRVGQFEDSGNCKGFAFLDFRTTQEATAALLDPRNHIMDGRELKLEYAGPDAVRRSGLHESPRENKVKGKGVRKPRPVQNTTDEGSGEERLLKRGKFERESGKGDRERRKKPGAALAGAPREQAGIVESTGKKIVF